MPRIKIENRRPERPINLISFEINTEAIDVTNGGLLGGEASLVKMYVPGCTTATLVFKDHIDVYGRVSWKKDVDGGPLLCLRNLLENRIL